MVIEARDVFGNHIFKEIIITACWIIWTTRNRVIFDNACFSLNIWKEDFKKELGLVCIKTMKNVKTALTLWRAIMLDILWAWPV